MLSLLYFLLMLCVLLVPYPRFYFTDKVLKLYLFIYFRTCMVSGLTLMSIIYFKFIYLYWVRQRSYDTLFTWDYSAIPTSFVEKQTLSCCVFQTPLSMTNWPYLCGFISVLSILFYCFICLSLFQYYTISMSMALEYILKTGDIIYSVCFVLFFLMMISTILVIPYNFYFFSNNFNGNSMSF